MALKNYIRLVIVILVLVLPSLGASAQDGKAFQPLKDYPFVYISSDSSAIIPVVGDSLFNATARGIRFRVNRSELLSTDPFIPLYKQHILPILRQKDLVLRKVIVRGAASPEGPYHNNCRLGSARTQRLVEFLSSDLGGIDSHTIETTSICEDYGYLVYLLQQSGDHAATIVSRIWEQSKGDEEVCKRKLQTYDHGRLWKRLLRDYFPRLRQARVILFFGRKVEPEPIIEEPIVEEPVIEEPIVEQPLDTLPADTPVVTVPRVKAPRIPVVALRTNLLRDFFYIPQFGWAPGVDVQLEFFPRRGHLTYNLGFTWTNHRHWDSHEFFQIRDAQIEIRRYFRRGHPYRGAYLGAYAQGFVYGIGLSETKGWEGEGAGAGLTGGYTVKLTRDGHFRLELMAAVGFLATKYDPYVWGNPITGDKDGKYYYDYLGTASKFKKRNHLLTWFGPTNVGIQLTYDIIYRKREKGGEQ